MMPPAIILAGGFGTRVQDLTLGGPKCLMEIEGRAFIDWQLQLLASQGFKEVILALGHLGEVVVSHLKDNPPLGLALTFSFDGPYPLGTGGGTKLAFEKHDSEIAFVIYGDSLLPLDARAVFLEYQNNTSLADLMVVFQNENKFDKSNASFVDGLVRHYDKASPTNDMRHIDYGMSIISAKTINAWKPDVFDLAELYTHLSLQNKLAGFLTEQRFYEIGSHEGVADTQKFIRNQIAGQSI